MNRGGGFFSYPFFPLLRIFPPFKPTVAKPGAFARNFRGFFAASPPRFGGHDSQPPRPLRCGSTFRPASPPRPFACGAEIFPARLYLTLLAIRAKIPSSSPAISSRSALPYGANTMDGFWYETMTAPSAASVI